MIEKYLGKYRLDATLGEGAMGVVYRAYDPDIGRIVAIKTVRRELLETGDESNLLERFRNEARAAGRLAAHHNIVTTYDFCVDKEAVFLVMEYVEGQGMDRLLPPGLPTAPHQVRHWMRQVLSALHYAHERGVVHRDIKPSNLMVAQDDTVKIMDFGVARLSSSTLTQFGTVVGTPSYMAPEQVHGEAVDGRADLFASGVLCYRLLTGHMPFTGNAVTLMHKILNEHPESPSSRNAALPPDVDAVVHRALAKDRDDRFQSAAEFSEALERALASFKDSDRAGLSGLSGDETLLHGRIAGPGPGGAELVRPFDPLVPPPDPPASGAAPASRLPDGLAAPAEASAGMIAAKRTDGRRTWLVPAVAAAAVAGLAAAAYLAFAPATSAGPGSPRPSLPSAGAHSPGPDNSASQLPGSRPPGAAQDASNVPAPKAVDRAALLSRLQSLRTGFACSHLDITLSADDSVAVSGILNKSVSAAEVRSRLAAEAGDRQVALGDLENHLVPSCAVLASLDAGLDRSAIHPLQLDFAPAGHGSKYVEGEFLALRLVSPAFPAFLYLDYVTADGKVVHLRPSAKHPAEAIAAGTQLSVGDDERLKITGPLYGEDMLVLLASRQPLFEAGARPTVESVASYQQSLEGALQRSPGGAEGPLATVRFVQTAPRPVP